MPSDMHWLIDAAYVVVTAFGSLAGIIVGLKIKNAMLEVGGRIDTHVAECHIIRENVDGRLQRLEARR